MFKQILSTTVSILTFSRRVVLALCYLPVSAMAEIGYIAASDGFIYTFNPEVGGSTTKFTTAPAGGIGGAIDVAIDGKTGYIAGNDGFIYTFNPLARGSVTKLTTMPIGPLIGATSIAIDGAIGYVAATNGFIYTFNPAAVGPAVLLTTTNPGGAAFGVAIDGATGYISAANGIIYTFNPSAMGPAVLLTTTVAGGGANSVAINHATGYVVGGLGSVYTFNPAAVGPAILLTTAPADGGANGIEVNNTTGYIAAVDGLIYTFNPSVMGLPTPFTTPSVGIANGVAIGPFIPTTALTGNSFLLATYLNENAPNEILSLFSSSSNLPRELKSASPARNASATFMAQIIQLAFAQVFSHHQDRNHPIGRTTPFLASHQNPDDLFAWGKPFFQKKEPSFCKRFSPWLSLFGEYTRQNAQSQTPFFRAGSGGVVAALDYHGSVNLRVVGVGAAYAYTRLNQSRGAGHATINQAALTAYGTWTGLNWYCDFAAWGGLYENHNVRHVTVSSVSGNASSHTHGWQLTPHLEVGYVRCFRNTTTVSIDPFIAADFVNCWEAAFREHGLEGLNMGQPKRTCSLLRAEGGFRLQETATVCWGSLFFREKASYVYQRSFDTHAISAFLVGSPGSFTFSTFTKRQQLGAFEFEMFFEPCNHKHPYGSLAYQGQFSSSYQSQQGMLTIGMDF